MLIEDIDMTLAEAIASFISDTGKEPTNIYIGKKQQEELMKIWHDHQNFFYNSQTDDHANYKGLTVFTVDAEDHVGVS